MPDHFEGKAADWDTRPVPLQISEGVFAALRDAVALTSDQTVLDFGAGTGLLTGRIAPLVARVLAVDVSPAMLAQLSAKPELQGRVEVFCQDILERPLDRRADLVVSAMAAHHVKDTAGLMRTLFAHLVPGGRLALADLDAEDGTFHPPDTHGVFHAGFDRESLAALAREAGFADTGFVTACHLERDGGRYPIFLFTATRPANPA